ncbi:IS66 family insertion sequence element accessory protein TnpB [Limosilactobacillus sp. pH52_RY]|uniref:IS66 family insertion sequence element accessory protein TnpB n=1 Tax=Limosilactobacillus balticus TaxID=2759747 RepID=UPI0015FAB5FA|nr:IS66 family insertion sequence element accessory protein TnpB [Limosilactobacillus balticus]MBB1108908.1 IS66 family insertion sequence element accessory protein TnpB [Limosilactobacillus balticus]
MTEQNEIITPVFKNKASDFKKHAFTAHPAVKINVRELIFYFGFRYRKWLFVMLVNWHSPDHIYLDCGKTDMRKGIDGLTMVIVKNYGLELYNNSLFLFCSGRNVSTGLKK